MPNEITQCRECHKAYVPKMGEYLCDLCLVQRDKVVSQLENAISRTGKRGSRDLATLTGLPLRDVKRTMRSSHALSQEGLSEDECGQCRRRFAQKGSRFCLQCRLELHKTLGDATGELVQDIKKNSRYGTRRTAPVSTRDTLQEKRQRTGSHRFNPAPTLSKRYR